MSAATIRKWLYFALVRMRGQALGSYYERFVHEERTGIPPDTAKRLLVRLLTHCKKSVPYYAEVMQHIDGTLEDNPEGYLERMPILTKRVIRGRFDHLKSSDLGRRKWYLSASGGSTGEPVQFIQDWDYAARVGAISLLHARLIGREIGEPEVHLWGSVRDVVQGSEGWRARVVNKLTNTLVLNAFCMTPERIREFVALVNARRPKLITAYAETIYEVARFAEINGLDVKPQTAIITSAGALYPVMRDTIARVFQSRVYNRYGSREVGDIACERPGHEGLWVAPWGTYVEIVDDDGNRVPDGTEGEILVTSLTNFAMPLVRYQIGDRGVLLGTKSVARPGQGQVLDSVVGRSLDLFRTRNGTVIHPGYFVSLLYARDWIERLQVIQKSPSCIVFRIVTSRTDYPPADLDEFVAKARLVIGSDCEIAFEFVDDIPACGSGKYRYTISEVHPAKERLSDVAG